MTPFILLLLMLFAHVIEDFHLQGRLADMKQEQWWEDNTPSRLLVTGRYDYDYCPVLLLHGLEWAVCVSIPVMLYLGTFLLPDWYCAVIAAMALAHALVDHLKCNRLAINLVTDQSVHAVQIVVMWALVALI